MLFQFNSVSGVVGDVLMVMTIAMTVTNLLLLVVTGVTLFVVSGIPVQSPLIPVSVTVANDDV